MYKNGGQQQEETNDDESQDKLPYPFDPCGIRYFGHTEHGNEYAAGGGNHIGEAVAELGGHLK